MGLDKGTSRFAYSGTLKNTTCGRCGKDLNHLKADKQEQHAKDCKMQKQLGES